MRAQSDYLCGTTRAFMCAHKYLCALTDIYARSQIFMRAHTYTIMRTLKHWYICDFETIYSAAASAALHSVLASKHRSGSDLGSLWIRRP